MISGACSRHDFKAGDRPSLNSLTKLEGHFVLIFIFATILIEKLIQQVFDPRLRATSGTLHVINLVSVVLKVWAVGDAPLGFLSS